jgi:arylsulfatase A-like enzyme
VKEQGMEKNTMIVYMGDNGFSFGEHGLIDKRHAYEESMRVPLLIWAPGLVRPGSVFDEIVMNVDLAPTFLDLAGVRTPDHIQGYSFREILNGRSKNWKRDKVFYEYYWESAFPQTPTCFAVRSGKFKYIYYNGVWDINELFDLEADPYEMNNLIRETKYRQVGLQLKSELFQWLGETNGLQIPLKPTINNRIDNLYRGTY